MYVRKVIILENVPKMNKNGSRPVAMQCGCPERGREGGKA